MTGFDAALAEQRERSRKGTKADLARHAELGDLYEPSGAAPGRHQVRRLRRTTTAEGRVVAILRDGIEYEELEAVATASCERSLAAEVVLDAPRSTARAAGRSVTTACFASAARRQCALHGERHAEADRRA